MTYKELLLTEEWQNKRKEIVLRDGLTCSNCFNEILFKGFKTEWGIRFTNSDTGNVGYVISESPNGFIRKVFLHKDKSLWKYDIKYKEVMFYFDQEELDLEKEIIRPIAARRIKKAEIDYYEGLSSGTTFKLENDEIEWIYNGSLHVHHKYYKQGLNPWEYPRDALTTLCFSCHEKIHKDELIPCYDSNDILISHLTPCTRCFGAGEFPEYSHVQNGICFRCEGVKYEEFLHTSPI